MSTMRQPTSQRDDGNLQPGSAEESILHFWNKVGHFEGWSINLFE